MLAGACVAPLPAGVGPARVHRAPPPSPAEPYCTWFGDARDGVLHLGTAPFWAVGLWAGRGPATDAEVPGPLLVSRFDLASETFLPPLWAGSDSASGSWDVLAREDGVWFTSYFGPAGRFDPAGHVERFPAAGPGLNELESGPGDSVLATRYAALEGRAGSVVVLDADGGIVAEHPLEGPEGFVPAAKSVAWDPVRREIWVNTDLFPAGEGEPRHDTRVLAEDGRERLRFREPHVHFMRFAPDGTGFFAELYDADTLLSIRIRPPERADSALLTGLVVPLDADFPAGFDVVQDIQLDPSGAALLTRWSGVLHWVEPDGRHVRLDLPPPEGRGLYYTAVRHGHKVCASRCDELTVVCADLR